MSLTLLSFFLFFLEFNRIPFYRIIWLLLLTSIDWFLLKKIYIKKMLSVALKLLRGCNPSWCAFNDSRNRKERVTYAIHVFALSLLLLIIILIFHYLTFWQLASLYFVFVLSCFVYSQLHSMFSISLAVRYFKT